MIISHKHRFIFLKTTKTASTSIEIALSQHCGPDDVITSISAKDEAVRKQLGFRGPQNCDLPLKTYGVRDWLGLISSFKRRQFRNHNTAAQVRKWIGNQIWNEYFVFSFERNPFDKAVSRYFWSRKSEHQTINDFLKTAHRRSLTNWSIYTIKNEVSVDFVGRFEHLTEDLESVWRKLKLPGDPVLPRVKATHRYDRRHYSDILDTAACARISRVCAREIAEFGYSLELGPVNA